MADRLEEAEFWLPSEFLTDEDILMDNKDNHDNNGQLSNTAFCFPTEFPYDFDSVVNNSSDEEDLLTELTRQLTLQHSHKPKIEKSRWVMAGSPQSTLVQVGSWSGWSPGSSSGGSPNGPSQVSSPPTTPLGANNDAWNLIHQAASQVAKLKMNGRDAPLAQNRGLFGLSNSTNAVYNTYVQKVREEQMVRQQQQSCAILSNGQLKNGWTCEPPKQQQQQHMAQNRGIRFGALMENEKYGRAQAAAWPSLQYLQQQNGSFRKAAMFLDGGSRNVVNGGVKRQCAGTGVFLPRPSGNNNNINPAESRKKPGCSTALLPARVVHTMNRNFNDMNVGLVQPQYLARFNGGGYVADYDTLMARRNALLMQRRRNLRPQGAINHEISLPQEWTY